MLDEDIAYGLLEVERVLLHLRVQLTVDIDAGIEVPLRVVVQHLTLRHNSRVYLPD